MELHEVHRRKAKEMLGNEVEAPVTSETDNGPYLKIPMISEEPETLAVREGIHERIEA